MINDKGQPVRKPVSYPPDEVPFLSYSHQRAKPEYIRAAANVMLAFPKSWAELKIELPGPITLYFTGNVESVYWLGNHDFVAVAYRHVGIDFTHVDNMDLAYSTAAKLPQFGQGTHYTVHLYHQAGSWAYTASIRRVNRWIEPMQRPVMDYIKALVGNGNAFHAHQHTPKEDRRAR